MSFLYAAYRAAAIALAILSGVLLVLMTVGIGAEAIMRTFRLGLIRGIVDFSEHALFNIAILAAPWVLMRNGHIVINILTAQLTGLAARMVDLLANLIALLICGCIAFYGARIFWVAFGRGEYIFRELVIPEWWLQWQVPVAFALLTIEFARRIVWWWRSPGSPASLGEGA